MRFLTLAPVALCAAFLAGCKSGDSASSATPGPSPAPAADAQKSPPVADTQASPKIESKTDSKTPIKSDPKVLGQLVGTWTSGKVDAGGQTDFTFDAGGTFTVLSTAQPPGEKSIVKTTMKGTFIVSADKLVMHVNSVNLASPDPKLKPKIDEANAAAKDASKLPEISGGIAFKDKNDAALTMESAPGANANPQPLLIKRKS